VRDSPCFFFQRTNAETRTAPLGEILMHEFLEGSAALALSDVDQLMHNQFAVLPAISPNHNSITDGYAAAGIRNDLRPLRRLRECFIVRKRNSVDHQDSHPRRDLHANPPRIRQLPRPERGAMFENESFLRLGPFTGNRRQKFEFFLINHVSRRLRAAPDYKQVACKIEAGFCR